MFISTTNLLTIMSSSTKDNLIIGLQFWKGFSHLEVSQEAQEWLWAQKYQSYILKSRSEFIDYIFTPQRMGYIRPIMVFVS